MKQSISASKIKKILKQASSIDSSRYSESDKQKIQACKDLLSAKRINFDSLAKQAGCPYFYSPELPRLCDFSADADEKPCDRCWYINLSDHIKAGAELELVMKDMEYDAASYKKLLEYEDTGMTPGMISQVLKTLGWHKGMAFDEFYTKISRKEESNE